MRQKTHIDFTILLAGALVLIILFATSCGPVIRSNCPYSKGLLNNQGSPQKAFKF